MGGAPTAVARKGLQSVGSLFPRVSRPPSSPQSHRRMLATSACAALSCSLRAAASSATLRAASAVSAACTGEPADAEPAAALRRGERGGERVAAAAMQAKPGTVVTPSAAVSRVLYEASCSSSWSARRCSWAWWAWGRGGGRQGEGRRHSGCKEEVKAGKRSCSAHGPKSELSASVLHCHPPNSLPFPSPPAHPPTHPPTL